MIFVLDENLPPSLAEILRLLGQPVESAAQSSIRKAGDPVLAAHVAERCGILITRDGRMLRNPAVVAEIVNGKVGFFCLPEGEAPTLELARILLHCWPDILRVAATEERPFFMSLHPHGAAVRRLRLR